MKGTFVAAAAALVAGANAHAHGHAHQHKARTIESNSTAIAAPTNGTDACADCKTVWQYEWEGKTITVESPAPSSAVPVVTMSVPVVPVQVATTQNDAVGTSSAPEATSSAAIPSADACATVCYEAYNTCRGSPDANRATCASQYATCLGYSPYDDSGSLVTPTACSTTAAATPAPSAPVEDDSTTSSQVISELSLTATTTNSPIFSTAVPAEPQPTPIVSTIETPGIYTIPPVTVTLTKETTVCGATTTSVPAGPATYGGVVTVVVNATVVTCPYAAEVTNTGVVTQTVLTTTFECPSAGTYTPVPQTTTSVSNGTIIVYPVPVVYKPGTYTAPETVVTATKTDYVYYCPLSSAESSTSIAAVTTTDAPAVVTTPEAAAPTTEAPVVVTTPEAAAPTTEAPAAETTTEAPATTEAPVVPTTSVEEAASTSSAAATVSSSSGTSGLTVKGDKWAMTYTPYTSAGQCKTKDEVATDIASIAAKGFAAVRLYGTDCSGLVNIGDACAASGLKIILGVFIDSKGISGAAEQVTALVAFAHWSIVELVVIGNEAIFNGYCSASELAGFIASSRSSFSSVGYSGPITTTETLAIWQANTGVLCAATDITGVNMHPFFNAEVSAATAGAFALAQQTIAAALCPGHDARNLEIGWPTQGTCNGQACPGVDAQKTAIEGIIAAVGSKAVIFSFSNDMWKAPGTFGCEQYWGVSDLF